MKAKTTKPKRQLLDLYPQLTPAQSPVDKPTGSGPGTLHVHDILQLVRQKRREDEELLMLVLIDPN